jgi:hypothetical protein
VCNFEADIAVFVFFLRYKFALCKYFFIIVEVNNSILDPLKSLSMVRFSLVGISLFNVPRED